MEMFYNAGGHPPVMTEECHCHDHEHEHDHDHEHEHHHEHGEGCCCGAKELTPEMLECLKATGIFALATADEDGVPNVVPVGMLFPGEDGKIWIVDNFFNKTLKNLQENPVAAFYIWSPQYQGGCWQIKGRVEILNEGPDYEKAVFFAHSKMENAPAKHLVKLSVLEVYTVAPGPDAGAKVL